jgi:hypothetical protein
MNIFPRGHGMPMVGVWVIMLAAVSAPPATDDPPAADVGLERADAAAMGTASVSGIVDEVDGSFIEVHPYDHSLPTLRLRLNPQLPVFRDNARVTPTALHPGAEVRVHYRATTDLSGYVATLVDVLDASEARLAERVAQATPPRMSELPVATNEPHPILLPAAPLARRPPHLLAGIDLLQKQKLLQHASGSVAGEVLRAENGYVMLAPFRARMPRTFRLPADSPVYDAGEQLTPLALTPGSKVRVFYEQGAARTLSKAVAVEVLTPDELRTLEGPAAATPPGARP